eukprot:TRINITY_DN5050_c0_g1_i1.p1 TRINITY_DN5050_c0_g1~~TRINITY_DN5050_c0_g1_i1.p1  ORF type:complete len:625 (-),score=130.82 TRINITY_DN5050_c0_g1_i1:209-2083(-)
MKLNLKLRKRISENPAESPSKKRKIDDIVVLSEITNTDCTSSPITKNDPVLIEDSSDNDNDRDVVDKQTNTEEIHYVQIPDDSDGGDVNSDVDSDEDEDNDDCNKYEIARRNRIIQNKAKLGELGITMLSMKVPPVPRSARKTPKKSPVTHNYPLRSRKARRLKSDKKFMTLEDIEETQKTIAKLVRDELQKSLANSGSEENVEDIFVDSAVLNYICSASDGDDASKSTNKIDDFFQCFRNIEKSSEVEDLQSDFDQFRETKWKFFDNELTKVYTLDFTKDTKLMAAAGHKGRLSVYGVIPYNEDSDEEDTDTHDTSSSYRDPLISFRAHSGWVSNIQFMKPSSRSSSTSSSSSSSSSLESVNTKIISSSNDKAIKIFDLSKTVESEPKLLCQTKSLHTSGIFSMHYYCEDDDDHEQYVLSASKDSRVVYSRITPSGICKIGDYNCHTSVVKCCRFRDKHSFASTGNDGKIMVVDTRSSTDHLKINAHHTHAINHVTWSPTDPNILLSAGFDKFICVYDIRNNTKPLHILDKHISTDKRLKNIYKPIFNLDGKKIITVGEGSTKLTTYCVESGKKLSVGSMKSAPGSICLTNLVRNTKESVGQILAVVHSKEITLYSPFKSSTK